MPTRKPNFPAWIYCGLCILVCAFAADAADRAGRHSPPDPDPGRSIEIGLGSGINIGTATRYAPYLNSEWMNYIPHAYLAWSPTGAWRLSAAVTKVNAGNWCVLCSEKVSEDYAKLALGAQYRLGTGQGILVGAELFMQDGTNTYTRLRKWMSDIDYEGEIRDRYTHAGFGLSAEIPLARMFSFGARLNRYSELYHYRSNTLVENDIYEEVKRPVVVEEDGPGAAFSMEIFIRMGLRLGY